LENKRRSKISLAAILIFRIFFIKKPSIARDDALALLPVAYLMSNVIESGSGRSCSGPKLLRSRDFVRPRVGLDGSIAGSIANDDRSFVEAEKEKIMLSMCLK
jgi:hypothetical protein